MANQKISQLNDGNPAQAADQIPINRAGVNFSITAGSVASLATANSATTEVLFNNAGVVDGDPQFTFNPTGDVLSLTGQLNVDNIRVDGNTVSSTDTNGNIDLTPNGTGEVNISKVDIDSGAIDGTTIGANSAAAGTFTTATATTGNITTVNATTVDTTNLEVTNIKALDGTAAATVADTTGIITTSNALLRLAGTTSSFPALKRDSTTVAVRLADDSGNAPLSASTLSALAATANTSAIASTGYSVTGSNNTALADLAGTWNTTGTPTAVKVNITDTASNGSSLLMDLQTTGVSQFSVNKAGGLTAKTGVFSANAGNLSSIAASNYALSGTSAVSMVDLAGTWNTTGTPSAIKVNITDTASNAASLLMDLQVGGTSQFSVAKGGSVTVADAANFVVGTSTGTKIGTATSQKIGFWNAAPIVQPTTGVAAATVAATGVGDVVAASTTFDGYTIGQIVKALRNAGLLA